MSFHTCVRIFILALVLGDSAFQSALGQAATPNVSLTFGLDTTVVEVRDIVRLTTAYLQNPDSALSRGLWTAKSKEDSRFRDVARSVYQGFPATILGVTGTGPGDSVFVVKVLFAGADKSRKRIDALALQRFIAVRAPDAPFGWELSSPLPRLTANWPHRTYGPVTFWYGPGQRQSPAKARQAVQFIDSVAKIFRISPPEHLNAYLSASTDESERLMGLDFSLDASGPGTGLGGKTNALSGLLFFADPKLGEAYLHEFVHAVVGPKVVSKNAIFGEGVAVWLGGSRPGPTKTMYRLLEDYQARYPAVSMLTVFGDEAPGGQSAINALYASRALIIDSIFRHSGITGVLAFGNIAGSPEDLIKALPRFVPIGPNIDEWWRAETERAARR